MDVKRYGIVVSLIAAFVLLLPAAIVYPFSVKQQSTSPEPAPASSTESLSDQNPLSISVYRSKEQKIASMPLEQYVTGVVASEMPATFDSEALKAQALAARTYIINYLMASPDMNLPKGADVCDTVNCQVYKSDSELKK